MTGNAAALRRRLCAAPVAVALGLSTAALATPALAAQTDLLLASTSDGQVKGNGGSSGAWPSADGSIVTFSSTASNLDPADVDAIADVYVKDLVTGDIVLASTSDAEVKGNGSSYAATLSADGRTVAFTSAATNLDPADTDSATDVYVKDLASGDIVLASTSDSGVKGNGVSVDASLSADGRIVAFSSSATNLDPADTHIANDVYVKNLTTSDLVLASTSSAGVKGTGNNYGPSLSADGGVVAFYGGSRLDPRDSDVAYDIYVKDLATGGLYLASTSDTGVKGNRRSMFPSLSADGDTVAFESSAGNLDPADTQGGLDVFVKVIGSGDIVLASTSDSGVPGNGVSTTPSLSEDGTMVAMLSFANNWDTADVDNLRDVYVKDLTSGDVVLVSISADGVKSNRPGDDVNLSTDGRTVAFSTRAKNLDPADLDDLSDVYVRQASESSAPTVTATTPLDDQAGVAVFASPTATFSELVTGVTEATFTLSSADGSAVPATVSYDPITLVARLDPMSDLAQDSRYTATLVGGPSGIQDLAGNALVTTTWSYLTGPRPSVTKRTPGVDATGVWAGANVTATFREPVKGVNGSTFTLTGPSGSVPAVVTYDPTTRVATLNPSTALLQDTPYTATLTGGTTAIRDIAGNPLISLSWGYLTGPRPKVTATTPPDDATGVSRTADIKATFDERVVGVSFTTFTLKNAATGTTVTAVITRNGSTNEWILNPNATLAANTLFTATLTGGTTLIRDLAGNPLTTTAWSFTTGP